MALTVVVIEQTTFVITKTHEHEKDIFFNRSTDQ